MARSIWTGTIGFGLVQIPVSLHTAEESDELDFTLLDRRDFSPIGYERINKKTGKTVPWEEIVKGHETSDGKYVVLTDADFEEANVEATHRVDILDFVDFAAIDPRFVERPYYIAPSKAGAKAYAVLRETLKRTGKAGVGKIVIRTRQHLAAVVAGEQALELIILRFADELRSAEDLELPEQNLKKLGVSSKELEMAEQLVSGMVAPFKPEQYEDEYKRDVMKLIRKKAKAGEVNSIPEQTEKKPRRPAGAEVIDLASLLASSLKESRPSPSSRSTRKKSAAAAHPRKSGRAEQHRKSA